MSLPPADELIANLRRLGDEFGAEIAGLATEQEIRLAQARYLGRKGRVTDLMKALGKIPPGDRPRVGEAANQVRDAIEGAVGVRLAGLAEQALAGELARTLDVTLPARGHGQGTLHPLTLVRREIEGIFQGLGYEVRTGPWVETEWNNFDALNTPADHPARDMQDTFFVDAPAGKGASNAGSFVLRSHTSPVQVRTMLAGPPPVKIIAPGNVFRRDDDATHTPMFPQVEGLYVDRDVNFEDLKATLIYFVRRFFGPAMNLRLRPSFFPFTEPSAEVDASCFQCKGEAPARARVGGGELRSPEPVAGGRGDPPRVPTENVCRLCKGTGWIEIGGCGMVHPNVLRAVGYDQHDVTGFAFGMGLSRMAMLKYGINDLRLFYENDLRFLNQFRAGRGPS